MTLFGISNAFPIDTMLFSLFLRVYLFVFREGKGGRERNISVPEKHPSAASRTLPTRDLARKPGVCPDWESNQCPFGLQYDTRPTEPYQLGMHF